VTAQVVVCGSSGSLPGAGRACSGYLVRSGDARIVLDLGNGSLANLLRHLEPASITDVVVSHGHHDHFADLVGLWQLVTYGMRGPDRLRVWANAVTCEVLDASGTSMRRA
jgi:ribonuclease BN (tRNA processing enzyme)